ncbi:MULTISPECIES: hypothetical protein [Streptomyces]|uniref:hypothetical protein n=1 Tax=Streptomyces TaxID=1883 RepID=UPI0004AB303A|nr:MULTISPECIES: hypothetical protein [Streptomyces]
MKKPSAVEPETGLDAYLLRRHGMVRVAPGAAPEEPLPWSAQELGALEADLAQRGYVLTRDLRAALGRLRPLDLSAAGTRLLWRIDALLGANRSHQPLFRSFPEGVPSASGWTSPGTPGSVCR